MHVGVAALLVLAGLGLLKFGADYLLKGALGIARGYRVSELVIGLTIVAVGTSAPELVTSFAAALRHEPGIVLGNAIGSNIANLTLALGMAAVLGHIPVEKDLLFIQKPALLALTLLVAILLLDGSLSRYDGALLTIAMAGFTVWLVRRGRAPQDDPSAAAESLRQPQWMEVLWLLGGLGGLVLGAAWLVQGASAIASRLGMTPTAIGATVVALGTSAPELAASFAAVRSKSYAILLGNLIGSCQFNLAAILGLPALLTPIPGDATLWKLHLPMLLVATVAAVVMAFTFDRTIRRQEGVVLLLLYGAYLALTLTVR